MKRKFCFVISVVLFSLNLFATSGSFWGEKDIRVTKTQWFDLIYTPKSEQTAKLMYEKADGIYVEVAEQYGLTPQFRMPVVITAGVETFNAFWTVAPYNHIVIYDTSINGVEDLAVFSETLLSVFRHELTHAVTNNMKNSFWKGVGKVIGDPAIPGLFFVSTGMAEGATVTSESATGEGRLNDEYAKQTVKQAKLEGKFPASEDVIGSRDKYPGGAAYFFYGAFHQWLQDNYGMEAYAAYWYNVVNFKGITEGKCFSKAFGISKKKAWKQFITDYEIPDIPGNPVEAQVVKDFFKPSENQYSINNNSGKLYSSLTVSDKWIAWVESSTGKVQYINKADAGASVIKPKTLFTMADITEISLSPDGRLMAVSCISQNTPGSTGYIVIYDTETRKSFTVKQKGLKGASVIHSEGQYYLVANRYISPYNNIYLEKIIFSNNKITATEPFTVIQEPLEQFCYNFTGLNNGQFAYIKKDKLKFSICICNADGSVTSEISIPKEKAAIRSLSAAGNELYFSWTEPGIMPRVGKVSLSTSQITLDTQDISGGIYSPCYADGNIVYIGNFYNQTRILTYANAFAETQNYTVEQKVQENLQESQLQKDAEFFDFELEYTKYNPLNYVKRGILIPISTYTTEYFGCNSIYSTDLGSYLYGLTYITADPWTNGANNLYTLTLGLNRLNNALGLGLTLDLGTDTSLLATETNLKTEFDTEGWKLSSVDLVVSTQITFGKVSSVRFANQAVARVGRQDRRSDVLTFMDSLYFWDFESYGVLMPQNNTVYYSLSDTLTATYSNIHKAGPNRFAKAGFSTSFGGIIRSDKSLEENPVHYTEGYNMVITAKAYVPKLIPVENNYGFVYNLPTRLDFSLLPTSSIYGRTIYAESSGQSIFDLTTETVLFGMEAQKAVPFVTALYINDFYISGGYSISMMAGQNTYKGFQFAYTTEYLTDLFMGKASPLDSIYLKGVLEITPNIGFLAKSTAKTNLYAIFNYSLHTTDLVKNKFYWSVGLQSNF